MVKLFSGLTSQSKGKPLSDNLTLAKDRPIDRSGTAIIAFLYLGYVVYLVQQTLKL